MKKRIVIMALVVSLAAFSADLRTVLASDTVQSVDDSGSKAAGEAVSKSLDKETFSAAVDFVKEKLDAGELENREQIRQAIEEGEAEFGFDLSKNTEDMIVSVVEKVQKLGLDSDVLAQKAEELYDTYGDGIVDNLETVLTDELKGMGSAVGDAIKEQLMEPARDAAKETVKATAKNFWTDLKNSVVNFVKNIFHI